MANNYSQATISPFLPASSFTKDDLAKLEICGISCERSNDFQEW